MVDTVLYFEGDTHQSFRLIRAFKNRFGAVNELGVFAMTDKGLKGVANPSAIFLSGHTGEAPGSCILVAQGGSALLQSCPTCKATQALPISSWTGSQAWCSST
jgi:DNA repair protein RadA/Sms